MGTMVSLTLAIPEDLRAKMNQFPDINWSEVVRQAIIQKIRILEQMQRVFSSSTLTEADTIKIGRQIKKRVLKKHQRAR